MPENIMSNYNNERRWMVASQLIPKGIKKEDVLESMAVVPRHLFVPEEMQVYAYEDRPLPIAENQTISQPYIVALMAEALETTPNDRVLEIGTGSGYSAAVLSRLVNTVFSIERHQNLAHQAISRFKELYYANIHVLVADGTKGWLEEAPFDGILVTAGGPQIPQSLLEQLAPGGRLVIPVGERGEQELMRVRRSQDGSFTEEDMGRVCFVPLIGEEGWGKE